MKDDEITEREITERLKSQKPVRLDPKNRKEIPASPGVYGGFYSPTGECLHVGKSDTSLQRRICDDHFSGGGKGAGSDCVQKLQDHGYASNRSALARIRWGNTSAPAGLPHPCYHPDTLRNAHSTNRAIGIRHATKNAKKMSSPAATPA
jgi:hypothetical protein